MKPVLPSLLASIRPHQWAKNLVIFVPMIAAHRVPEPREAWLWLLGFVAFSACASGVYLINDLCDLREDRKHPEKAMRPIASGALPTSVAAWAAAVLLVFGIVLSWAELNAGFLGLLLLYVATAVAYSCVLKKLVPLDVLTLAGLYTLRALAGGQLSGIHLSDWLTGFCLFLFLNLALLKRYAELVGVKVKPRATRAGDYNSSDAGHVVALGHVTSIAAVLILALYIHSPEARLLYRNPRNLWLLCPLLFFSFSRLWLFAGRGLVGADPVLHVLKDKSTYAQGVAAAAILVLAT
jgi:4-hydroxybenzoate polyprenyltransferase